MKRIQIKKHPTSDIQRSTSKDDGGRVHWWFEVGCWRLAVPGFRLCCCVLLIALATCTFAPAQSNNVPGPTDYAAFSRFVSARNIFDPNRVPRTSSSRSTYRPRVSRSAPTFTLVGTMSYEKGMFAFFDGNNSDLRKVLYQSDSNSIAGFSVAEITLAGVKLQSVDKKRTEELKIGDGMRQEGSAWRLVTNELASATSTMEGEAPAADDATAGVDSAPASAGEPNDILKKLMQQREQELK